ncbi:hypothetical protein J437_LFUL013778 [Ladona fulva]|uniref:Endonuclease/exonuclease/phosphatase domain-containing protein n=1 Tax=Ladona fulva TaxID=123851 RepID=A0A8K0KJ86_LADFU|nr:hypothetical protein J437_LFUL013778 [Ladona fulva]
MITPWSGWVKQWRRWVPLQEPSSRLWMLVKRKKVMVWVPGPIKFDTRALSSRDWRGFTQASRPPCGDPGRLTKSWDLLVGCDSNSHHSVWGSSDVNPRGESLLEYLMTTELQLLNRGSQPTFRNSVTEEVIDITLCASNIVHKINGWRVSGETSLSDHCHILFTLSEEARQVIAYRDPKATNWDLYRSELKRDIEGISQHKFRNRDEIEASSRPTRKAVP